jgi:hypothetical protein
MLRSGRSRLAVQPRPGDESLHTSRNAPVPVVVSIDGHRPENVAEGGRDGIAHDCHALHAFVRQVDRRREVTGSVTSKPSTERRFVRAGAADAQLAVTSADD